MQTYLNQIITGRLTAILLSSSSSGMIGDAVLQEKRKSL